MGYTCLAVLVFTQAEPQALQKELGEMGLKRWASGKNDHRATSLNDIARAARCARPSPSVVVSVP